jgi:hypothetical protein
MRRSLGSWVSLCSLAIGLAGCGSSSPTTPITPVTQPPAPHAAVTATGVGLLVVHPSADSRFAVALETPIRIQETGGGTADWNFARISLLNHGAEIERGEIGADVIKAAGYSRITARSNAVYTLYFHFNSSNFDQVNITLGFGDVNYGAAFNADVPFNSFSGVDISIIPKFVPSNRVEKP